MSKERLVVIGNGTSGARFVDDLLLSGGGNRFEIVIFADESDHHDKRLRRLRLSWYAAKDITLYAGTRVEQIDLCAKQVITAGGVSEEYDKLVIAIGSSPMIPPLADARRPALIDGGVLGLEAARELLNVGLIVTRLATRTTEVLGNGHVTGLAFADAVSECGGQCASRQADQDWRR